MHAKFAGILSFFRTVSTFASCSLQGSGRGLRPVKMLEVGFLVILAAVTPIFYFNATPETVARRQAPCNDVLKDNSRALKGQY